MSLVVESPENREGKAYYSIAVVGNGPAFLQTILMLDSKDVLPVTNNDADFLTLQRLGASPIKKDFKPGQVSFLADQTIRIVLVSSTSLTVTIVRALENNLRRDQVLIIAKEPKKRPRPLKHPYVYWIEREDLFDRDLRERCNALYRLSKINEFLVAKQKESNRKLKVLMMIFGPPDPDAIASGLAFSKLFSKTATTYFAATARVKRFENRALLSYLKVKILDLSNVDPDEYDVRVCVDAQPSFFEKSGFNFKFDICIDHHPEANSESEVAINDIRKNYGACSTIMAQYYFYSRKRLTRSLATALLFGIKTDTLNLTRSAYAPDIKMMTFLHSKSDQKILKRIEFSKIPMRALKYFKRAYNRYYLDGACLVCHLGRVSYLDIGSIIAEHFLKIQKVRFSIVSCVYRDKVIIFFRSVIEKYHAGESAAKIFKEQGVGGGHHDMGRAECRVQNLGFPLKHIDDFLVSFVEENK